MIARRVLKTMNQKPFGHVAYGSGHQISKSIEYLRFFTPQITSISYVGDLDHRGIYIAAKLQRASSADSHLKVSPANPIHAQMLAAAVELGSPNGWPDKSRRASEAGSWIYDFLDASIRPQIKAIVETNHRIPEEVIHEDAMRSCLEHFST